MSRVFTRKTRMQLDDMGFATRKMERRAKRKRDAEYKRKRGRKRYYNA